MGQAPSGAVFLHGRAFLTPRRVALVPILAATLGTVFEVERHWGWWAAAPLIALTFLLIYRALRSGILAPQPIEAPPVLPAEPSR